MGTLRRTMWRKLPRPIEAVSPSPLTPMFTRCVCGVDAHGDRRHAPVHRVEAVRATHEVRVVLLEQPMPLSFAMPVRLDAVVVVALDDRRGDRVVTAAGAERRLGALVHLMSRFKPLVFPSPRPEERWGRSLVLMNVPSCGLGRADVVDDRLCVIGMPL